MFLPKSFKLLKTEKLNIEKYNIPFIGSELFLVLFLVFYHQCQFWHIHSLDKEAEVQKASGPRILILPEVSVRPTAGCMAVPYSSLCRLPLYFTVE